MMDDLKKGEDVFRTVTVLTGLSIASRMVINQIYVQNKSLTAWEILKDFCDIWKLPGDHNRCNIVLLSSLCLK